MKPLDFVVIGASKSGTTSLFHYLREHPAIWLPTEKDAPFFSADEWYQRGWESVVDDCFHGAPEEALWGTVTPRYMEDPRVPQRMAALMPNLKLIALLRNPIDRALSQYRQQVRRGKEKRSFEEAVSTELTPKVAAQLREQWQQGSLKASERYLLTGEYGRILEKYRESLPRQQFLILFSDQLLADRGKAIDAIISFLGLQVGFRPVNLDTQFHTGGDRERFPGLLTSLKRIGPVRWLWHLLPRRQRKSLWVRFFTQINVVSQAPPVIQPELRKKLVEFFRPDLQRLSREFEVALPWNEFDTNRA